MHKNRRILFCGFYICESPAVGGGGEIRTLDTLSGMPPFQGGALDHYATPPYCFN
jgi:hypothetical protein